MLLLVWVYAMFVPELMPTKPILALVGPKCSAKTSLARRLSSTQPGALSTAALAALTATQFGGLNLPADLRALTGTQRGALSEARFAGLTATELRSLTAGQIKGITASAISAPGHAQAAGFSTTRIGGMSSAQKSSWQVAVSQS